MKLISQISDLKAVSGGYIYDEFVTANAIFYQSVFSAVSMGFVGGLFGFASGGVVAGPAGAVAFGALGTAAGGYLGFNYNEYSDIEPNTWVRWDVTVVYY